MRKASIPRIFRIHHSAFIIFIYLSACGPPVLRTPAAPSVFVTPPAPTAPPLGPPPTPTCSQAPAPPRYDLDLTLDYGAHIAHVSQTITLVNGTAEPWRDLALAVSANHAPAIFTLAAAAVDGYPARHVLDGVAMRLLLPAPLEPGCRATVSLDYALALPQLEVSATGWRGVLGWTPRQILLGHWYPTLVPYHDGAGWLARRPAEQGEFETTEASDVNVRLTLPGVPPGLAVVASSAPQDCPPESPAEALCFALAGARHFALALSDQMETASARAGDTTVTAMFFPEHSTAGRAALAAARQAFSIYTDRYGPVPYTWLAVVEADIPDGMEFTGLFFLAKPYYAEFDGSPQNYLTLITVHETAHQWWYSLVGNDPATEPWLDEALATYSEQLYFETAHPDLVEWWWGYRVWLYLPEGQVGSDIYASPDFRPYVNAVYLNGAQFLHALRGEAGDEAFFSFLRAYAERGAGRVVTADEFWEVYSEFGNAQDSPARRAYFETP
jgi:hypothetical protein